MNPAYSSIALAVFSLLSLFLYPCFLPSRTYADDPLPINPSLTIGSSGTLAFDVTPGQFNSGSQSISVATSNYTGYTLRIAPSSGNDTDLVNPVTGSSIPTITLPSGQDSITSSSFSAPSYGMSIDGTNYTPVTNGAIIKTTGTDSAGTDDFNLYIGAKVASNTPAGTYSRQFTLTATANEVAYAITYNSNDDSADPVDANTMPTSPQTSGVVSGTSLTLASETPARTGYDFLGWSTDSSATTATYAAGGSYNLDQTTSNQVTLYAVWRIKTYDIAIKTVTGLSSVSLNGTSCTSTSGCTVSGLTYKQSYALTATPSTGYSFTSWDAGSYGSIASTSSASTTYTVGAGNSTITPTATANQYTCTKQYRLQNADGTYPSNYTAAGTEQVNYGATCTYTPSAITDYTTPSSTSGTMTENGLTLSVDYPRTTYTLTVNRNTSYIASVSPTSGTYRWGQSVSISATASSDGKFKSWSQTSGTTGTFGSTSTASTTFTMGKGNATIYADGEASCTHTTFSGDMQNYSLTTIANACEGDTGTLTDRRTSTGYGSNASYTVAKLNGELWMTQNLAITGTIPASGSNFSGSSFNVSQYDLETDGKNDGPCASSSDSSDPKGYTNVCSHYSAGDANTGNKPTAWYNFAAASAGSVTGYANSNATTGDICPAGWRLPTRTEQRGITSLTTNFSPVSGGLYFNGGCSASAASTRAYWWSSTSESDGRQRNRMYYYSDSDRLGVGSVQRYYGHYVRCVRSS